MKTGDDRASRHLSFYIQPCTRLQMRLMRVKRHIRNEAEKDWSWNLFEIISWNQFVPLYANCSNKGRHVAATKRRNSRNNFKCAWKGSEPKLLTLITSNKNGCESNKNLKTMNNATNARLPKKTTNTMVLFEMRFIPPLELGNVTYQRTKGYSGHWREHGPKSLSKTCMKAKSKETN
jgi:hypothetical protein